ncbi:MAG: NAD(P)/FAD-dependent oxidoreductase [Spirochaetae bacterium HGW-Spirochaetae-5]|nr:MAG: NAD(P)/FAD-dependent oxidoreductase [Spirochaetae bacterium HGW-Spirochaetae-5]
MKESEVIIIGQGPAGLSAGIYTSRAGINTLILGCEPKIAGDYDIDNYFGFPETLSGKDLIERGMKQAERFGASISCDRVIGIHFDDTGRYIVKTENDEYRTCAVILATGVSRKKPPIPGFEKYDGKGISYCVSCDGFFFKGKRVIVAGEGLYAANQALELVNYTPDVSICTLGKESTITDEFMKQLEEKNIKIIGKGIASLHGDMNLEKITFTDGSEIDAAGIFIALGDASSVDFARSLGVITEGNFIQVDRDMNTNAPGIFAAGDCTGGFLQISVAVGEGAVAGKSAIEHVRNTCRGAGK